MQGDLDEQINKYIIVKSDGEHGYVAGKKNSVLIYFNSDKRFCIVFLQSPKSDETHPVGFKSNRFIHLLGLVI